MLSLRMDLQRPGALLQPRAREHVPYFSQADLWFLCPRS